MGWQEWQGCRKPLKSMGAAENAPQNTPKNVNNPMALSHFAPRSQEWVR
jgi:hypothetical protein